MYRVWSRHHLIQLNEASTISYTTWDIIYTLQNCLPYRMYVVLSMHRLLVPSFSILHSTVTCAVVLLSSFFKQKKLNFYLTWLVCLFSFPMTYGLYFSWRFLFIMSAHSPISCWKHLSLNIQALYLLGVSRNVIHPPTFHCWLQIRKL